MLITTKQCFKCMKTKPLTAYYKHRQMGDGHLGKCKECTKLDATTHRNNNLDKIREYDRGRGFRGTRGKVYKQTPKRIDSNCNFCGSTNNLEKHHPDYSKPSWVVTLCRKCHRNTHAIIRLNKEEIYDLAVF